MSVEAPSGECRNDAAKTGAEWNPGRNTAGGAIHYSQRQPEISGVSYDMEKRPEEPKGGNTKSVPLITFVFHKMLVCANIDYNRSEW